MVSCELVFAEVLNIRTLLGMGFTEIVSEDWMILR